MGIYSFSREDICKIMHTKSMSVDGMSKIALDDEIVMDKVLKGLSSKNDVYRYNCYKVLDNLSRSRPEILFEDWEKFAEMLKSSKSEDRSSAVKLLSNLSRADPSYKDEILDFIKDQLDSSSPRTRKAAEDFLQKY